MTPLSTVRVSSINELALLSGPAAPTAPEIAPDIETRPAVPIPEERPEIKPGRAPDPADEPNHCPGPSTCPPP